MVDTVVKKCTIKKPFSQTEVPSAIGHIQVMSSALSLFLSDLCASPISANQKAAGDDFHPNNFWRVGHSSDFAILQTCLGSAIEQR